MGAATALLVNHPKIVGRVSDSAYTSVPDMCRAIAVQMGLPNCFVSAALWYLRKKVAKAANFNMKEVSPITIDNGEAEVPAVFGHAVRDQFVPFEHCNRLYAHYQNRCKSFMQLSGGHNSRREFEWIELGVLFCFARFGLVVNEPNIATAATLQSLDFHFVSFEQMVANADPPTTLLLEEAIQIVEEEEDTTETQ
jgi:hypothetical protein